MKFAAPLMLAASLFAGHALNAQSAPSDKSDKIDHYSTDELVAHAKEVGGDSPLHSEIPGKYPNHYTMLVIRHADGQSEFHQKFADVFIILDGGGEIVTGGSMVGAKQTAEGEQRGDGISGGTTAPLKKGDIVHIPAGIPHQVKIAKGGHIVYFVVKADQTAGAK
ncbi:MAG TPA: hypothetical protein VGB69_05610 [Edaphobacter sp.]